MRTRGTSSQRAPLAKNRREETRARIIQSAIPIFAKHGPDKPVVDDFIEAAGVSRGTFYNYFRSTHELLEAATYSLSAAVAAEIVPVVEHIDHPIVRLATEARIFHRHAARKPLFRAFLGAVSGVGLMTGERIREDLTQAIDERLIRVRRLELAEAITAGVMVFSLKGRVPRRDHLQRGKEVVEAILEGLGASPALIKEALAAPLD